jgi:hypothetical protein
MNMSSMEGLVRTFFSLPRDLDALETGRSRIMMLRFAKKEDIREMIGLSVPLTALHT